LLKALDGFKRQILDEGYGTIGADYPALLIYAISVQRQNGIAWQMTFRFHAAEDKESDIAVGYHIGHNLLNP
jgi:hypothetical protein